MSVSLGKHNLIRAQIYQFNIQSLKVLAESPLKAGPVIKPSFPDLRDDEEEGAAPRNTSSGLLRFGVKRARVD